MGHWSMSNLIYWVFVLWVVFGLSPSIFDIALISGFGVLIHGFVRLLQDPSDFTVWDKPNG